MKTKHAPDTSPAISSTATRPSHASPTARRRRVGVAVAAIALIGLTACTSDPGPKRVAEDIIRSIDLENEIRAEEGLPPIVADEECLLTELDKYSDSDLKAISDDLTAENSERNAEGETAIAAYELSLARCVTGS